jgi:hypothetical protein
MSLSRLTARAEEWTRVCIQSKQGTTSHTESRPIVHSNSASFTKELKGLWKGFGERRRVAWKSKMTFEFNLNVKGVTSGHAFFAPGNRQTSKRKRGNDKHFGQFIVRRRSFSISLPDKLPLVPTNCHCFGFHLSFKRPSTGRLTHSSCVRRLICAFHSDTSFSLFSLSLSLSLVLSHLPFFSAQPFRLLYSNRIICRSASVPRTNCFFDRPFRTDKSERYRQIVNYSLHKSHPKPF